VVVEAVMVWVEAVVVVVAWWARPV